jgi:hypothetical protein
MDSHCHDDVIQFLIISKEFSLSRGIAHINRIPVIRALEVRATVFFTSKIHALNT